MNASIGPGLQYCFTQSTTNQSYDTIQTYRLVTFSPLLLAFEEMLIQAGKLPQIEPSGDTGKSRLLMIWPEQR